MYNVSTWCLVEGLDFSKHLFLLSKDIKAWCARLAWNHQSGAFRTILKYTAFKANTYSNFSNLYKKSHCHLKHITKHMSTAKCPQAVSTKVSTCLWITTNYNLEIRLRNQHGFASGESMKRVNNVYEVEIPKWDKYQNDRTSLWFKVRNDIFMDTKFAKLSSNAKCLLLMLWSIRAKSESSSFQVDDKLMSSWLQVKPKLIRFAFHQLEENQLVRLKTCTKNAPRREEIRRDKKRREERRGDCATSAPPAPVISNGINLISVWNEHCGSLPKVRGTNNSRDKKINQRLKENPDQDYWISVVTRIAQSDFCNGKNDRSWVATFDWLLQPETNLKVSEGKYDNRKSLGPKASNAFAMLKDLERGEL